jgi:hypothetical protein
MASSSDRHIWVSSLKRDPPDYSKLGRALIAAAAADLKKTTQAQQGKAEEEIPPDEGGLS